MDDLKKAMFELVPENGTNIGNKALRQQWQNKVKQDFRRDVTEPEYWQTRNGLVDDGILRRGQGRGGSVLRVDPAAMTTTTFITTPAASPFQDENSLYVPAQSAGLTSAGGNGKGRQAWGGPMPVGYPRGGSFFSTGLRSSTANFGRPASIGTFTSPSMSGRA